ncbi:MAG TPA: cell cycle transcriptional regulator TrcR [Alphaproteobacteria bacterium]|nr:cell cycle transcriptional regulator TrcR [Alphaproteobacteria bacterium]
MTQPLMPKATAVWLIENTGLSFEQIAEFCGIHELEVKAIADGEVAVGMVGADPVGNGQLTRAEIEKGEADPNYKLKIAIRDLPQPTQRAKGPRYTPVTKRGDKPDAVAWLLKNNPELSDAQISRLIGTTKPTIQSVRDRTHWNAQNIKPRNPVLLGLCTQRELDEEMTRSRIAQAKAGRLGQGGVPLATAADDDAEIGADEDVEG